MNESMDLQFIRDAILDRVLTTLNQTGDAFPYFANSTGNWTTTPNGNWCGGHWIGLLWLTAEHASSETDRNRCEEAARSLTDTMHAYMTRRSMFCGMNFHYAGFRAYDQTGDRSLFGLGLEGADAMVDLFHEHARQVVLGELDIKGPEQFRGPESDHGPPGSQIGAVDSIYTAGPVLWRAYEETGRTRFRDVAVSHADRHLDWYIREEGSTWHHALFDPDSGELESQYNELAMSDETCWSRGQAWNIAGLCRAYRETKAERYLDAIHTSIEYYRTGTIDGFLPPWDFTAPEEADTPPDTSAAAITAYGLTGLDSSDDTDELKEYGERIVEKLVENALVTDPDAPNYGAVLHGCFNKPGEYATDNELIWTNYYLLYTLCRRLDD